MMAAAWACQNRHGIIYTCCIFEWRPDFCSIALHSNTVGLLYLGGYDGTRCDSMNEICEDGTMQGEGGEDSAARRSSFYRALEFSPL